MRVIRTRGRGAREAAAVLAALECRGGAALDSVLPVVKRIVAHIQRNGDRALLRYAAQFDGLASATQLRIDPQEMAEAWRMIDPSLREALRIASRQIRVFSKQQLPKSWSRIATPGLTVGQLVRPIGSVGCYVPSGRHPLPSTLLMTAIPAQVAGVKRIVVVSPKPAPETLAAAHLLGITEFYRVGGAHAIAALAYGTATIARVDKIVGPGNLYVTAAKRLVAFDCAIDMLAGPTEIVVTSERGDRVGDRGRSSCAGGTRSGGCRDLCDNARRTRATGNCRNREAEPRQSRRSRSTDPGMELRLWLRTLKRLTRSRIAWRRNI